MANLETPITVFKDFTKVITQTSIRLFLDEVKTFHNPLIKKIRDQYNRGKKKTADDLKKELKAVTFSATYANGRKKENITNYNRLIILDFDNLEERLSEVKKIVSHSSYTIAAFISPKGNGLKVLIGAESNLETHSEVYLEVANYYQQLTNSKLDMQCKDVGRLCFYSYDPDLFINDLADIFPANKELIHVPELHSVATKECSSDSTQFQKLFDYAVQLTNRKRTYVNGSRNNYIFLLASNSNRLGIPKDEVIQLAQTRYTDLSKRELEKTISSAYESNQHEHGLRHSNPSYEETTQLPEKEDPMDTPFLPDQVFNLIPHFLQNYCSRFTCRRERDVFFLGAIGTLSGCITGYSGTYHHRRYYANLYIFIIAPSSSGKSALNFAKQLGQKYHDKLVEQSRKAQQAYEIETAAFDAQIKGKKDKTAHLRPPAKPPFKLLYIPANTSSSRVLQHMQENDEEGVFFETEADSMNQTLKQDWGGYSVLLRKAFQHESDSYSRKLNNEFIDLKSPKLSIVLSGTLNQVTGLIKSAEDGLFSRFIHYLFKSKAIWKDVSPNEQKESHFEFFEKASDQVVRLAESSKENPCTFSLTRQQWDQLNKKGAQWLEETNVIHGEETGSVVKRTCSAIFRLSMLFTAIDRFERNDVSPKATCKDEHFKAAVILIEVLMEHNLRIYHLLPKSPSYEHSSHQISRFIELLPLETTFTRKEAHERCSALNISTRTIDKLLSKLVKSGQLKKAMYGQYIGCSTDEKL